MIEKLSFVILISSFTLEPFLPINCYKDKYFSCPGNSSINDFVENPECSLLNNMALSADNNMILYFRNLHDFSPMNSGYSCGYVSLIQYLSYYDCFYNDSIIPEYFEMNQGNTTSMDAARAVSPGVLRHYSPSDSSDLYHYVAENMDTDYQMYLMYIVNNAKGNDENSYSPSIGMWDYHYIFEEIPALSDATFEMKQCSDLGWFTHPYDANAIEYFDNYVKGQLDDGNPVILHIGTFQNSSNDNYHSVVAYYYDDLGIHANFGWDSIYTDVVIGDNYQIKEAGVLDFSSVEETHSHNFIVNNNGYCGCGIQTNHNYSHHYEPYSTTKHKAYCLCGSYALKPHSINYSNTYIFHGHTYGTCFECGVSIDLGGGGPIIPINSNSAIMISNNGSVILPNGIYLIVDSDIWSYKNGTLIFHNVDEETI